MHRYFIIYKPYQVLSQFSPQAGKKTLKDFFRVPTDVYPVGRLDYDSEGLLILTNDPSLNHRLLHPKFEHEREYLVQVEGIIDSKGVDMLRSGPTIVVDGKPFRTKPARVVLLDAAPNVPERIPPVRFRKSIPASWISITLTEGKNRQVRKMTAAAGYPTLRLIRLRIMHILLDNMQPGEMRELKESEMKRGLC